MLQKSAIKIDSCCLFSRLCPQNHWLLSLPLLWVDLWLVHCIVICLLMFTFFYIGVWDNVLLLSHELKNIHNDVKLVRLSAWACMNVYEGWRDSSDVLQWWTQPVRLSHVPNKISEGWGVERWGTHTVNKLPPLNDGFSHGHVREVSPWWNISTIHDS